MIFFNPQLMKTGRELTLFLVSNPVAFTRFEDHEAALQITLHELVEQALRDGENPIALIEEHLRITYAGSTRVEDIANFLISTPQMLHAMHRLKDHWAEMDEKLPGDSLLFGGQSREEAVRVFSEITLRTWIIALSGIYDE